MADGPDIDALVALVRRELAARGDPARAAEMAAYMKSRMPFYGVPAPERKEVFARMRGFASAERAGFEAAVLALWALPHREERYAAIAYARQHPRFHDAASLPLFERLVREGAWWDLVDEVAVHLVGAAWLGQPERVAPAMDRWIEDEDRWLRRAALIGQNRHQEQADEERLFRYCALRAGDPDFFVRKAIGWALREHSKAHPIAVAAFLLDHRDELSGLSFREASRRLEKAGIDLDEL